MARSSTVTRRLPNRIATHPGEILGEEFLKPLGMSVHALALALRVPATRIGAIVKGERSVSADTALRLARFFGTSPEFWMNLQAKHDLTKARMDAGAMIEREVRPHARSHRRPHERGFPLDPLVPNDETIEAMKATRRGDLTTAGRPKNLIKSLDVDD